jgi:hypothetical protein
MERVWVFEKLAVTLRRVDFLDPAYEGQRDVRERGVRIEVKPAPSQADGSIYASDTTTIDRALARLDFLESAPGKADRMHWHPEMAGGEPGDRTFDVDMPADPRTWLERFLAGGLRDYLREGGHDLAAYDGDLAAIADTGPEICRGLDEGLAWAREPWPDVAHDERGMAVLA